MLVNDFCLSNQPLYLSNCFIKTQTEAIRALKTTLHYGALELLRYFPHCATSFCGNGANNGRINFSKAAEQLCGAKYVREQQQRCERERVGERRERKERRENEVEMLKGKCVNSCSCRVLSEQRSLQRFSMSPALGKGKGGESG